MKPGSDGLSCTDVDAMRGMWISWNDVEACDVDSDTQRNLDGSGSFIWTFGKGEKAGFLDGQ